MTSTSNAAAQPMPPLGPPDSPELTGAQLSDLMHRLEVKAVIPDKPIDLPASALYYAKRGWPVFPCAPRGKTPLTSRGFKEASTDPEQIEAWAKRHPDANWATPTGPKELGGCGFDVLDIDGDLGISTVASLPPDEQPPAPLALAFTPGWPTKGRGPGRHHYLPGSDQGNMTGFLPGCDMRSAGGYVLLSPSLGPHGVPYHWIQRPDGI